MIWPFSTIKKLRAEIVELKSAFNQTVQFLHQEEEQVVSLNRRLNRVRETALRFEKDLSNATAQSFLIDRKLLTAQSHLEVSLDILAKVIKSPSAGDDGTVFRAAMKEAEDFYNSHRSTKNCIMCGSKMIELRGEDKKLCSNGACGHEIDWPLEEGQDYMYKRDVEPFVEDRSNKTEELPPRANIERL
jgi:NADH pyrophosphatase NudC (nudix superfamily)